MRSTGSWIGDRPGGYPVPDAEQVPLCPAVHGPARRPTGSFTARRSTNSLLTPVSLSSGAAVGDLIVEDGTCTGVIAEDGREWRACAVVLTTGTFLGA